MNGGGGAPEAGSEFANRAAAAGEVRRPGFGVTGCHLQGIGERLSCVHKIILFLSTLSAFSKSLPVLSPRRISGQ